MKNLLTLAAIGAAILSPVWASASEPIVVELYTSQGCSSCPPADAKLGEIAAEPGFIGLSFHVDYWDYIGWKDPFARPEHGKRQRAFANKFGMSHVYTPQMVVQGITHAVGSRSDEIADAVELATAMPRMPVTVTDTGAGVVQIEVPNAAGYVTPQDARVILIGYDAFHETAIKRGENSGKKLGYTNVVRSMEVVGDWSGDAVSISAALPAEMTSAGGCVVIIQSIADGRILGAAQLKGTAAS